MIGNFLLVRVVLITITFLMKHSIFFVIEFILLIEQNLMFGILALRFMMLKRTFNYLVVILVSIFLKLDLIFIRFNNL